MSGVNVNDKVMKNENNCRPYLVDLVSAVLVEVVVAAPFFFVTPVFVDDFLFLFLCVALATASLYGNIIPDVEVGTTMLLSVLQVDDFLRFVFCGPLKYNFI